MLNYFYGKRSRIRQDHISELSLSGLISSISHAMQFTVLVSTLSMDVKLEMDV